MKDGVSSTKKNFRWYMRYLHNKIGFFLVGLVIVYSLSGIVQTYRDTNFLKHTVTHEKQLAANLVESQVGTNLKLRDFKIIKTEGSLLYYKDGTYNTETGMAKYVTQEWYSWITPFTNLHKTASKGAMHYLTTLFGISLFFMAISAFWMFKPGTKLFSSGVYLAIAGVIASIMLLVLQ